MAMRNGPILMARGWRAGLFQRYCGAIKTQVWTGLETTRVEIPRCC
jgi:hypothetical protein